jgi:hypothetical protein
MVFLVSHPSLLQLAQLELALYREPESGDELPVLLNHGRRHTPLAEGNAGGSHRIAAGSRETSAPRRLAKSPSRSDGLIRACFAIFARPALNSRSASPQATSMSLITAIG